MAKTKTLGKVKQDVQNVVNKYIRLRDKDKPCISCGKYHPKKQAGHFHPVKGYDGLRFDEDNINGECPYCNCWDDGHLIGYSERLRERIGSTRYYGLIDRAHEYKCNGYKFTRSELVQIKQKFNDKIKELC